VRKLTLILPFVAILAVLAGMLRVLAVLAGESYIAFNPELEGARILEHRARLSQGDYPPGYDFYFAGTSRTMADFSPGTVAAVLNASCHADHALRGYDLGNVADDYGAFYDELRRVGPPRLLVLELMTRALLEDPTAVHGVAAAPQGWLNRDYRDYKTRMSILETYVAGGARALLGLGDLVNIRPGQLVLLWHALQHRDQRLARVYYALRNFQSNGSRMAEGGQVDYRSYLPDARAAALSGDSASEYQAYAVWLQAPPSAASWQDFVHILDLFGSDRQVVVVRAPVDPAMYALEQQTHGDLMARAAQYLGGRGIAYIDLNSGSYHSTDLSHIDWYDTARLSEDFAKRLAPVIRPGLFGAAGCG
jgi:hypothetical protein